MADEIEKIRLTADLFDNQLTEVLGDYSARIRNTGTVRNPQIADRILARGSEFRKDTIINILNMGDEEKVKAVAEGKSVVDGTGQLLMQLKGAFDADNAPFDSTKHSLVVAYIPGKNMRAALKNVLIETRKATTGPSIGKITDPTTGKVNETITPSLPLIIDGANIKIAGTGEKAASLGVFFVSEDETATTPAILIVHNNPSQLTVVAPALGEGQYFVELRTQYSSGSGTLVKEPRTSRYPLLLTVGSTGGGSDDDDRPVIE